MSSNFCLSFKYGINADLIEGNKKKKKYHISLYLHSHICFSLLTFLFFSIVQNIGFIIYKLCQCSQKNKLCLAFFFLVNLMCSSACLHCRLMLYRYWFFSIKVDLLTKKLAAQQLCLKKRYSILIME